MKRAITSMIGLLLILFYCTSCGIVKKINKVEQKDSEKTSIESESKDRSETKTDLKSSTVTTETADTTVNTPKSEIEGSRPADDVKKKPLILEDDKQVINVSIDSAGNLKVKGTVKPQSINFKVNKRTERKEDLSQVLKVNTEGKVKVKEETKSEFEGSTKDVKKTFSLPWWIWLLLLAIAVGAYLLKRFKIKIPFT